MWIFSGRTLNVPARPRSFSAASPLMRLLVPTKPATNSDARLLVDLGGRADLLDPAVVEDGDPVAHRQRLVLVVGHEDEGDADVALQALELDLHLFAQLEVERAERLVEQEHLRLDDEGAGEGDALPLAARQLGGLAVAVLVEAHLRERLVGELASPRPRLMPRTRRP